MKWFPVNVLLSGLFVVTSLPLQGKGATLSVSPSSIAWNTQTSVVVTASGLDLGETVQFNLYADIDQNGTISSPDHLIWSVTVTDGITGKLFNPGVGDKDGATNQTIELQVPYNDLLNNFKHVAGDYLWEARRSNAPPVTALFQVLQETSSARQITGRVVDYVTGQPVSGAMAKIIPFSQIDEPTPAVWADTNGLFTLYVPSALPSKDVQGVFTRALGYLSAYEGPNEGSFSAYPFSSMITNGVNALPQDLLVASAWPGNLITVSGQVQLADAGNSPVPGAMVFMIGDDVESFSISDSNGVYQMVFPSDMDLDFDDDIYFGTGLPDLNIREIVGTMIPVTPAMLATDLSTNLICRTATAVLQGTVTCSAPAGTVNSLLLNAIANDGEQAAWTLVMNGYYRAAIVAGDWYGNIDEESAVAAGYYAGDESFLGSFSDGSTNLFPIVLPNAYTVSGTVYDPSGEVALFGGYVDVNEPSAWGMDVNFSGEYKLILPQGTWSLFAGGFRGYSSDTLSVNVTTFNLYNRHFYLNPGAIVSGHLKGDGLPLPDEGGWVTLLRDNGNWLEYVDDMDVLDGTTAFEFTLDPGVNYVLQGNGNESGFWIPENYNNSYSFDDAYRFNLSAGEIVTNILIDLQEGVKLTGRVLDINGVRQEGVVQAINVTNESEIIYAWVDYDGTFEQNIPAGTAYYLRTGMSDWAYPAVYYNQCYTTNAAVPISGSIGQTISNLNFEICLGYRITGRVYDQNTYNGLPGMLVIAANTNGYYNYTVIQDLFGSYDLLIPTNQVVGLHAGYGQTNWIPEYHDNTYSSNQAAAVWAQAYANTNVNFGLLHYATDSDLDGMPDWQEQVAGTSPYDDTSLFMITNLSHAATQTILKWTFAPDRLYTVQRSADLASGFTNLVIGIENDSYTNAADNAAAGFYRVSVEQK